MANQSKSDAAITYDAAITIRVTSGLLERIDAAVANRKAADPACINGEHTRVNLVRRALAKFLEDEELRAARGGKAKA